MFPTVIQGENSQACNKQLEENDDPNTEERNTTYFHPISFSSQV
jgi:hypothetical protein